MPLPKNLPRSAKAKVTPPPAPKKEDGKVLANRYRLETKLGSGAFGCAYMVTDLKSSNERYDPLHVITRTQLVRAKKCILSPLVLTYALSFVVCTTAVWLTWFCLSLGGL